MKSPLKRITAFALALAMAAHNLAWGAGLSVMPLPMWLSPDQPSDLLKVSNDADTGASFQIQAFLWTQSPDGTIDLQPSPAIVAFPEVFTIGPNETRNIRVGVLQPPLAAEATFRLIVQQLPPPPLPGRVIQILPGINLPVFMARNDAVAKPEISRPVVAQARLSFALSDAGTAHLLLRRLTIMGRNAAGGSVFSVAAAPSYVLAGGRRDYALQIGAGDCAQLRTITIMATFADEVPPVTQPVAVPPEGCAGAPMGLTGFTNDTRQQVKILPARADGGQ
jgi:fimbrial chaperone protein